MGFKNLSNEIFWQKIFTLTRYQVINFSRESLFIFWFENAYENVNLQMQRNAILFCKNKNWRYKSISNYMDVNVYWNGKTWNANNFSEDVQHFYFFIFRRISLSTHFKNWSNRQLQKCLNLKYILDICIKGIQYVLNNNESTF